MLAIPKLSSTVPIFAESKHFRRDYIVDPSKFKIEHRTNKNIALPLIVDSEFYAPGVRDFVNGAFSYRKPVTIQVKHIHENDQAIFVDPAFAAENEGRPIRHPIAKHPFIVGDYLESYGHKVFIEQVEQDFHQREVKPPMLLVVLYAHFALADIGMVIPDGDFKEHLAKKFARKQISMNRRVTCGMSGRVKMPWLITIDGHEYQIALKVVDTGAIHGIASYKDFCANSGVTLDSKDLMKDWITKMDQAYFEVPEDFDDYALGDLMVYEALKGNANGMKSIWNDMGVGDYFEDPRLSIGASVSRIYEAKNLQLFNVPHHEVISRGFKREVFFEPITGKSTAYFFSSKVTSNAYLLAKCDGGRCASNAPTITTIRGNIVDIDIAGCYASSMSKQDMPYGVPVVYATPYPKSGRDKGVPLREVLRAYEDELVDGLWGMRVRALNLDYDLDLMPSWFDMKRTIIKRTDSDSVGGEVDITSGVTKMFTREVINGMLTSDVLEVLRLLNPRQANDFFDKCEVLAFAFYPKSREVTVDDFAASIQDQGKKYKSRSKVLKGFEEITQEKADWCRVNLGEFFSDQLKAKRKMHKGGTPANAQYKLIANTLYGVQVSRFFPCSNVIVANNITARVRAAMFMFEKSLNLVGSITDGQAFDLNNVLYRARGKYLKTEALTRIYCQNRRELQRIDGGKFGTIEGIDEPTWATIQNHEEVKKLAKDKDRQDDYEALKSIINRAAYEHACKVWPNSKLLTAPSRRLDSRKDGIVSYIEGRGVFEFEMKSFAKSVTVHGSSNYSFDGGDNYKFRGYEKKTPHQAATVKDGEIVWLDTYNLMNPAQYLFHEIENTPRAVHRLPPFIKTGILKPNAYAQNYRNNWANSPIQPGDNILKIGRPSYFSPSQFKYRTREQFENWKRTTNRLKNKHGESFEMFFSNPDGTLDYQRMIETIDSMIREGVMFPLARLDPNNHLNRIKHPIITEYKQAIDLLKVEVKKAQLYEESSDDDWELIDTSDSWRD